MWIQALQLPDMCIDRVEIETNQIRLAVHLTPVEATCPKCIAPSRSVHSRYNRTLHDLPVGIHEVYLCVSIRRFRCRNAQCSRTTFAEPLTALTQAFARRTERLTQRLRAIGLVAGGEAGSRLTKQLSMKSSPDTIIRILRQTVLPVSQQVRVLGVDDWAMQRSKTYGTILVDLERRQPVELLPDRTAETLAKWLMAHTEIAIVSRDRSTEYARGIALGVPDAQQIADRWHLLKNLREALERMLNRLRGELAQLPLLSLPEQSPASSLPSRYSNQDLSAKL